MRVQNRKKVAVGAMLVASVGLVGFAVNAGATGGTAQGAAAAAKGVGETRAKLEPLNNSPVEGVATVTVNGRELDIRVKASRLLKGMPHAQHIHFGSQARHECPSVRDDDNHDHRINTVEGQPAYGPVRVSLTKRGDTSAKSTLAINRFPTAKDRKINYNRDNVMTGRKVARAIRNGNAVVVIHGIDYNGNGKYDFGAGRSDLDPTLPAEATDPVSCGVLKVVESTEEPSPTEEPTIPVP